MRKLAKTFALISLALPLVGLARAETVDSTFLGGNSLYSNPANWSPAEVPNNTATKKYNVTAVPRFFLDNGDVTISNLTIGDWLLSSLGPSLTVTGATTINRNVPAIFLSATSGPITFSLGSLSTFANGV